VISGCRTCAAVCAARAQGFAVSLRRVAILRAMCKCWAKLAELKEQYDAAKREEGDPESPQYGSRPDRVKICCPVPNPGDLKSASHFLMRQVMQGRQLTMLRTAFYLRKRWGSRISTIGVNSTYSAIIHTRRTGMKLGKRSRRTRDCVPHSVLRDRFVPHRVSTQ
jgi:hypothetical protein